MTLHQARGFAAPFALLASLALLAGCGGGGDDTPTTSTAPLTYPSAGTYGWVLKASGSTAALKNGLSFVHPSLPDNEYVIEAATSAITDTSLVTGGAVNAAQHTVSAVEPHSLVYIFGGEVRSVAMHADGAAPSMHIKTSGTSSACRFVLAANDHANPNNSRYLVSTGGADGRCETTADEGRAEVRLSAGSSIGYTILNGDWPLAVSRDPVTLAPRGWIYPRGVTLWDTANTQITLRPAGTPAITSVVASTYQAALVDDGTRLSVINFQAGNAFAEVPLDAALTAGGGWQLLGYDSNAFYVYRNTATNFTSPWSLLKIVRNNPAATQLASGTGFVSVASMGNTVLYLTVYKQAEHVLARINKSTGATLELPPFAIDTNISVLTSANGRHLQSVVTHVGSASVTHDITIVDESGATLYDSPGSDLIGLAEASSEDFNLSENRTRYIFAQGYGSRAYSGAAMVSYDALTNSASVLGTLPGHAEYGDDFVFATAVGGPSSFGVGFATRSSGGTYMEQDAKVFSYQIGTASSLKNTSRR